MGAQTVSQITAAELEAVDPKLPLLYERDGLFYSFIEKKPAEIVSSREMRVPLDIRPGGKFSQFTSAGGDLGRGGGGTLEKAVLTPFDFKYAKEWELKTEWVTDDRRKAVVNQVKKEIATAMAEFRKQSDALALGNADCVLGTVSSVSASGGVDTVTMASEYGVRWMRFGQDVKVYDTTMATDRTASSKREITFYDIPSGQIKFASVTGITATDKIVIDGVSGANPATVNGLLYNASAASSGTWYGLNRANFPEIRANEVDAAGALALPHARLAINKIGDRLGIETQINCVAWTHPCQSQAYEELGQLVTVINNGNQSGKPLDLYFSDNMRLAGAPIKKHYSWSKKRIDFVDKSVWGRAELKAPGFLTIDGKKIFEVRGSSGGVAAAMITYIVASWNMYANRPPGISYIKGLTIPSGY